jgi:hypothetical protein
MGLEDAGHEFADASRFVRGAGSVAFREGGVGLPRVWSLEPGAWSLTKTCPLDLNLCT